MKFLLDTHILIWSLQDNERLNAINLSIFPPLLEKEGLGVVKNIYFIQSINNHPPTPSLVRWGRRTLKLMALNERLSYQVRELINDANN